MALIVRGMQHLQKLSKIANQSKTLEWKNIRIDMVIKIVTYAVGLAYAVPVVAVDFSHQ